MQFAAAVEESYHSEQLHLTKNAELVLIQVQLRLSAGLPGRF